MTWLIKYFLSLLISCPINKQILLTNSEIAIICLFERKRLAKFCGKISSQTHKQTNKHTYIYILVPSSSSRKYKTVLILIYPNGKIHIIEES